MSIAVRSYDVVSDEAFVMSTWLKNYRDAAAVRAVPGPIYFKYQRERIEKILKDKSTRVVIGCSPIDPEFVYGYAVLGEPNAVHYIYVKESCRNLGVSKVLLNSLKWDEPIFYTHKSPDFKVERKLKEDPQLKVLVYNPYLVGNP